MIAGGFVEMARATVTVFAFTAATLAVCFGLGHLLQRSWQPGRGRMIEVDTTVWIGWGAAVAAIQLWHLALPPGWVLALGLCGAGVAGLALARDDLRSVAAAVRRDHPWVAAALLLAALWLANASLGPPRNGDSGLYHLGAVRWAAAYPDVPGLANLLGRFGFTSSYTLWVALPEALAGPGRGCHLANAALLFLPIARGLWALSRLAAGRSRWRAGTLFDLLLLFPLLERVWSEQVLVSATPDLPVFVLGIVLTSLLIRMTEARDDRAGLVQRAAAVVWLAAVGATVKLSFAAFALAAAALASLIAMRRRDHRGSARPTSLRDLVPLAACCAVVVLPSLLRSVMLSGYPFYPLPALSVPTDWRVPHESALNEYNWVVSWARQPGKDWHAVLGNWRWFPSWVRQLITVRYTLLTVCLPLALAIVALIVLATVRRPRHRHADPDGGRLLALAPAAVSLVYWFATAPGTRFAGSAFWILGLGSTAAALTTASPAGLSRCWRLWALLGVGVAGGFIFFKLRQRGLLPVAAGSDAGYHPAPPVAVRVVRTASGLKVNVPLDTEDCWTSSLPCTPYLNPALRLRRDNDLRWGFTVTATPGHSGP